MAGHVVKEYFALSGVSFARSTRTITYELQNLRKGIIPNWLHKAIQVALLRVEKELNPKHCQP